MRKVPKFKKRLLLSLCLCGFGFAPLTYASILDYQDLILEGQSLTFNEKYAEAREKFQSLLEKEPEHPAGYFYLAMVYQARMKDLESDLYEKEFLQNLKKVIELNNP